MFMFREDSMRLAILSLSVCALLPSVDRAQAPAEVPVFTFTKEESTIKFQVKASVAIEGTFDKWDTTLTYPSTDVTAGVLDLRI
jgi:polyisoprenoid-binding protein YceI